MIDRIYYKSAGELVLIFTDRAPITVTSSNGDAQAVTEELFEETHREEAATEDTCPCIILPAA